MLHRISYYVINQTTGRRVKQNTPWHPDKAYVDNLVNIYYAGVIVQLESIVVKDAYQPENNDYIKFISESAKTVKNPQADVDDWGLDDFALMY